jgi:hypothetical protein
MRAEEMETKYIEERVVILRGLRKAYGDSIIERAVKAKEELIRKRVKEKFNGNVGNACLEEVYNFIFKEFEGVSEFCDHEVLEKTKEKLEVKVRRCYYAEAYKKLNAIDIGEALVCNMDYAINNVLNPKIKFQRPKKLMSGDSCCLFQYYLASNRQKG